MIFYMKYFVYFSQQNMRYILMLPDTTFTSTRYLIQNLDIKE